MANVVTVKAPSQRITIVVHPRNSDEALLKVEDALQQVLDFLRVAEDAKLSLGVSDVDFEWRLEWASTNSPFTLSAIAEPIGPSVDISDFVDVVKVRCAKAIRNCLDGVSAPNWLTPSSTEALFSLFQRNTNGLESTFIDFDGTIDPIEIDRAHAEYALPALDQVVHLVEEDIPQRDVYGELDGRIVSVGRYRNKPAFQLHTLLYGPVWCVLSPSLIGRYGNNQSLADV